MNKIHRSRRISVALTPEMLDDLRLRADNAGISVSRLIFLLLRQRKDFIIVPPTLTAAVRGLRKDLARLPKADDDEVAKIKANIEVILNSLRFLDGDVQCRKN